MKNPPTMRDVAAKAGVTPTVVSRVLHNKAASVRVSEATAVRVRDAAKDLGYRVNVFARNFRDRQTHMIGVLHGMNFSRPYFSRGSRYFAALMDGIVEGAFRHGYSVTLCPKLLGRSPDDAVSDGRFDGLIWYSTIQETENVAILQGITSPLVIIHPQKEPISGLFPTVSCDNAQGIGLALTHLTELGHRRIGFVRQGTLDFSESNLRRDAFLRGMQTLGLSAGEADVIDVDDEGIAHYLSALRPHTAVIAHNEELAAQVVRMAVALGVRVPEDLSVVGFDSTSYCDEVRPTVTAVFQPLEEIGLRAVDLLIARIVGETDVPPLLELPCHLDVRESTGPPRG